MPDVSFKFGKPKPTKMKGLDLLIQPLELFPKALVDRVKAAGVVYEDYAYTLDTLQTGNTMVRMYYAYNGEKWVTLGVLTGSATSPLPRFEFAV
jgi:hypothetical protein